MSRAILNGDHLAFEQEHANTPLRERPDWPLPSFDAKDWADDFCRRFLIQKRDGHKTAPVDDDVGLMIAWFANALMRGYDEQRPTGERDAVLEEIGAERKRQIEQEGWTLEHDDGHDGGEMVYAAACYALATRLPWASFINDIIKRLWPWDDAWWKPQDKRRDLIKAGALIVAEIERRDRKAKQSRPAERK